MLGELAGVSGYRRDSPARKRLSYRYTPILDHHHPKLNSQHAATLVPSRSAALRMYTYGGCDADFNYTGDLHVLNIGMHTTPHHHTHTHTHHTVSYVISTTAGRVYTPSLYKTVLRWLCHNHLDQTVLRENLPETMQDDIEDSKSYIESKGSCNKRESQQEEERR